MDVITIEGCTANFQHKNDAHGHGSMYKYRVLKWVIAHFKLLSCAVCWPMRTATGAIKAVLGIIFYLTIFSLQALAQPFYVVGSTAVFPFAAAVAERLVLRDPSFHPVIEANGTGAGFRVFCRSTPQNPIPLVMASRPIEPAEATACSKVLEPEKTQLTKNIPKKPLGLKIGYDGITLIMAKTVRPFALTSDQLFRALAKRTPHEGHLIRNPNKNWSDIDKSLPPIPIRVFGPPMYSGTRDAFILMAIRKQCQQALKQRLIRPEDIRLCGRLRDDEAYTAVGASENFIVHKTKGHPGSLGVVSYCFYDKNRNSLQAISLNSQQPNPTTITAQSYPLSRPLYLYVHPNLGQHQKNAFAFLRLFLTNPADARSRHIWLENKGLVILSDTEREQQNLLLEDYMRAMQASESISKVKPSKDASRQLRQRGGM